MKPLLDKTKIYDVSELSEINKKFFFYYLCEVDPTFKDYPYEDYLDGVNNYYGLRFNNNSKEWFFTTTYSVLEKLDMELFYQHCEKFINRFYLDEFQKIFNDVQIHGTRISGKKDNLNFVYYPEKDLLKFYNKATLIFNGNFPEKLDKLINILNFLNN